MTYELWDLESGNRLATFRTEAGAARYVLDVCQKSGAKGLSGLALGQYDSASRRTRRLATGHRLVGWAGQRAPGTRLAPTRHGELV